MSYTKNFHNGKKYVCYSVLSLEYLVNMIIFFIIQYTKQTSKSKNKSKSKNFKNY